MIERLPVDYYGANTPLIQLASISVPEPRQLLVRPFDPATLKNIERFPGLGSGSDPNSDGKVIRLSLPQLTEERRRELVRMVNNRMEEARVRIRNTRRDLIRDLREFEKKDCYLRTTRRRREGLQELTDKMIKG